jgi:hypothetical protein
LSISVVGYSVDSLFFVVGYSANFVAAVAYIADLYGKIISHRSAIGYLGD